MGQEDPKIPVHAFFAAAQEVINGRLTNTQVKTFLEMDSAAQTEYDTIGATAPVGTTALALAQKSLWLDGIHGIFILAEGGYPGYDTPADVRTKLGI